MDCKKCLNCGKEISSYKSFCNNKCQSEYKHRQFIEDWKKEKENGVVGQYGISNHIRRYLFEKNNYRCQICGWGEKNKYTNKIPLEVHHKDGDFRNNDENNLELLCPNCHSLTETFKSHNRVGRKVRKKYK